MKKWIEQNCTAIIVILAVAIVGLCLMCVSLPIIVHFCSPNINSEITADGLLGYIIQVISTLGTIFLACVAVWQNHKLQEESEKSQGRMEQIAIEANRISFIEKIVEREQCNYANLCDAMEEFSEACNLQGMITALNKLESSDSIEGLAAIAGLTQRIDDSFYVLFRELRIKPDLLKKDQNLLCNVATAYYIFDKDFLNKYQNISSLQELQLWIEKFEEIREEFYSEREKYLIEQETKLNKLIYGNMPLEEIKAMYSFYEKREKVNEQDENGVD